MEVYHHVHAAGPDSHQGLRKKWSHYLLLALSILFSTPLFSQKDTTAQKPLRVGIVGLVHTHVHWILGREKRGDIEIVGIAEPNRDLAQR